jgi:hypothetical protein
VRQVLHIFKKDTRRLWPWIAVVVALFAVYAFRSPESELARSVSLLDWNGLPAALVVLACWTLGAGVIHEDGTAEESPFWLTRPYNRTSLIGAKILFLFTFVFVPLALAGAVLEVRAGASVSANAGALLGLCLVRSSWLILPALSLGVVTRGLLDFAAAALFVWILLLLTTTGWHGILSFPYALGNPLQKASLASVMPMVVAGIVVLALQFAARSTTRSRGYIVAGVLLSGLLARDSVASFSQRVAHPGFDSQKIHVDFDRRAPVRVELEQNGWCADVPLLVDGLAKNMVIRGGTLSRGNWRTPGFFDSSVEVQETRSGYRAMICPAPFTPYAIALRVALELDVIEASTVATIPVKRSSVLDAKGAGRCEIIGEVFSYLRCTLAEPASGVITAGLAYPDYLSFARGFGDAGTFRLTPVLRQKFDGVSKDMPGGWPLDAALERGDARFILRNERVIGSLSRTLVYEGFRGFNAPLPAKPKQK